VTGEHNDDNKLCLLLNGTSALFRKTVPRIVEIKHKRKVKTIPNRQVVNNRLETHKFNI